MSVPHTAPAHPGPFTAREKAALAGEILAAYARVRWSLWRNDLRASVTNLRRVQPRRVTSGDATLLGRQLGSAVVRTLSVLPTDSRCLMRSLVLTRLLARREIDCRFVLGVRSGDEFKAHAWVERHDTPLLAPGDAGFERLLEL